MTTKFRSFCYFRLFGFFLIAGLIALMPLALLASNDITSSNSVVTTQQLGEMPLAFTKNIGQWPDSVLFRADAGGATMWFTKDGIYYQYTRTIAKDDNLVPDYLTAPQVGAPRVGAPDYPIDRHDNIPDSIETMMIKAEFVGANSDVEVSGLDELEYKCNYFIGNDPNEWHTDVPNYTGITMRGIYDGVDLVYRGRDGKFEYELSAETESQLEQVKVEYRGTDISRRESSLLQTKFGELSCNSVLISNRTEQITKELTSSSSSSALSSNVTLEYSTYLGGNHMDNGRRIAVDSSGSAYVTGETYSIDFPTQNPYQADQAEDGYDLFVTKLSSSGNSLLYSTYIGGSDWEYSKGIAIDGSGCAYVTGYTESTDYPTLSPYQGTYSGGLHDVFITKLSSSGNSLLYSSYLGGSDDEIARGIAVDTFDCAYVVGYTVSTDFPIRNAYQPTHNGGTYDAFITKFSRLGSSLRYSTYLGGSSSDYGFGIAVDGSDCAYVTGHTYASDFPTNNPYQGTQQGQRDIFVTKFSSSGYSLIYSTYLGGSYEDESYGIAVDAFGSAYVTGRTSSTDFPTLNPYQETHNGGTYDAIITKLNNSGDSLLYSTYLGGSGDEYRYGNGGIAVDAFGSAYVTGYTESTDFPTKSPYQGTFQGGLEDNFVTKLSSLGDTLIYSTYLGGSGNERSNGITVDASGSAYVIGYTFSSDFPTLNPYQGNPNGLTEVIITKLSYSVCCGLYTGGFTGNTNCDDTGLKDLADITRLIDNVYISKLKLCCVKNGNVNGDAGGLINLADITKLIDHVYITKAATAECE